MSAHRSVLFIIADDWSPIAECYNSPGAPTPHIDTLARQGMVFNRAFCTSPSCAVSRASLLTGLYSHQHGQYGHCHGVHGFRTHEGVVSLPALLKSRGVVTGLIGKSHVAPPEVYPFEIDTRSDPRDAERLADDTRRFLRQADGRPFFLMVAPGHPHRYGAYFHPPSAPPAARETLVSSVPLPAFLPDNDATRSDWNGYLRLIGEFDRCVGSILAQLSAAGREADTLVVVLSDHGMPFPRAKASPFEAGHRCPLIVRHPCGDGAAMTSDALVTWCDLAPTVCEWFDVPHPVTERVWTGRSILPLLRDPHQAGWDLTFYSHCFHEVTNYFPYRVARGRRYKLIQALAAPSPMPLPSDIFSSPTWQSLLHGEGGNAADSSCENLLHLGPETLIDLEADPLERTNRIDDPELADVADQLRRELMRFRERTNDPWLEVDFQRGRFPRRPSG
jgi:N-sulfoglucosamine sulfohydrolase